MKDHRKMSEGDIKILRSNAPTLQVKFYFSQSHLHDCGYLFLNIFSPIYLIFCCYSSFPSVLEIMRMEIFTINFLASNVLSMCSFPINTNYKWQISKKQNERHMLPKEYAGNAQKITTSNCMGCIIKSYIARNINESVQMQTYVHTISSILI